MKRFAIAFDEFCTACRWLSPFVMWATAYAILH